MRSDIRTNLNRHFLTDSRNHGVVTGVDALREYGTRCVRLYAGTRLPWQRPRQKRPRQQCHSMSHWRPAPSRRTASCFFSLRSDRCRHPGRPERSPASASIT